MERKCPNGGAMMTADVQHGRWVCRWRDCANEAYKTLDYTPGVTECIALADEEYQESMSPAEQMQATGAVRLC